MASVSLLGPCYETDKLAGDCYSYALQESIRFQESTSQGCLSLGAKFLLGACGIQGGDDEKNRFAYSYS